MNIPRLILASGSPRRKDLLSLAELPFEIQSMDIDETPLPGEAGRDYVLRLAESKAQELAAQLAEDALIVAADTTVVHEGEILGKPENQKEARSVLRSLRGKSHQVLTGVAFLRTRDGLLLTELAVTEVPMRDYTDKEIEAYVASGDPMDKAGSYAIQNESFHPVEGLTGCFANVAGLPLCHLARNFTKLGFTADSDIPNVCQSYLSYDCPVYEEVLNWSQ